MLFKSAIITSASGSIGGVTASRNAGGNYLRGRAIPVNPNTPQQQAIRSFLAQGSALWASTLTQAERDTWDLYAENVLLPNSLGDLRNVGGIAQYQRSNVGRLVADEATLLRVNTAPPIFDLGDYSQPKIESVNAAADTADVSFTNTDAWANEDAAAMLIYFSRPKNSGVHFFKGPYRFAHAILGNGVTAPTSPATVTLPFPVVAGQKVFMFVRVTRPDGRLSASFRDEQIAA